MMSAGLDEDCEKNLLQFKLKLPIKSSDAFRTEIASIQVKFAFRFQF